MKKLLTKLLAGFMTLACVCSMAACAPRLNIDDAEDALRDKGYEVEVEHNTNYYEIEGMVEKALYAERDDEWIEMVEFSDSKTAKLAYETEKAYYEAEIAVIESEIALYKHFLKEYQDSLTSEQIDEMEDEVKELKKEKADNEKELECMGRNGACIWFASSMDIIEDAK